MDINKLTRVIVVSPGSKHITTKILDTSKIYSPQSVKQSTKNRVRSKGLSDPHIRQLSGSLSNGINYTKNPPVVQKKPQWIDGVYYEYELIDGAHRFEAMKLAGITEWIFDIYELGMDGISEEKSRISLQLKFNDFVPEAASTADDIVNVMSYLIGIKQLNNNQKDIEEYLSSVTENIHGNKFKSIVTRTVQDNGSYTDVRTYPQDQLQKFLNTNPDKRDYKFAGKYDVKRRKYAWTVLEGYEHEYVSNAIKHYGQTKTESYFLTHTKGPTNKRTLNQKRKTQLETIEALEKGIELSYLFYKEHGKWPWTIEAFLGQDVKNNEPNFLSVDEVREKIKEEENIVDQS